MNFDTRPALHLTCSSPTPESSSDSIGAIFSQLFGLLIWNHKSICGAVLGGVADMNLMGILGRLLELT